MAAKRSDLASFLMRAWMRRGVVAIALAPLSLLFLSVSRLRALLYRCRVLHSTRLPRPVVVVGNVFIGGTGKTPFTIWLIEALRRHGYTPGIVSRGYGARNDRPVRVEVEAQAGAVGDEPLLLARRAQCPVMVGRDRVSAAQALLAAFPAVDIIVADDGLQHYALQRDVEIVVCDERGDGNGWVLPAGPLREPASRPRDFTVVNVSAAAHGSLVAVPEPVSNSKSLDHPQRAYGMQLGASYAERLGIAEQRTELTMLAANYRNIAAAAGIGNPARFFAMLRAAGVPVHQEIALPDHYDYAINPFAGIQGDCILITEKDAVKCSQLEPIKNDPRLWVVPVSAQIDAALAHQIVEKCRGFPTA